MPADYARGTGRRQYRFANPPYERSGPT